ncbi:putative Zn(2)-C6 fungal-type domain-containing protein [Seiridium unicorne]|uniref:Zn(2)-C6 fungal-type domain-containing protein n=1 Tax=Seiridium unicorne TaxID=138068 RepID=A0ABR2UM33_9PEZI
MGLVADAFEYHNVSALPDAQVDQFVPNTRSSFPVCTDDSYLRSIPGSSATAGHKRKRNPAQSFAEGRLMSVLPSVEVADLLVDNYFDQIHWFMLLFHQTQFRETVKNTYDKIRSKDHLTLTRLSVILASMALSLKYVDCTMEKRLHHLHIQADALLERILAVLRAEILEIMSQGCLESVQTCVLLGSYYLYHGEAQLAWPLCGCGLRIAQAIGLHRKVPVATGVARDPCLQTGQTVQARKRCWWAIYEIETFCSMLYGFPLSISDADCDIEALDTNDLWSDSTREPTTPLLHFKFAMSELSKIIKTALTELYSLHGRSAGDDATPGQDSSLRTLVTKITKLTSILHDWYHGLPETLRLWGIDGSVEARLFLDTVLNDQSDVRQSFAAKILRLQALTLHLAYNNAIIIIHRPILSHRLFGVISPQQQVTLLKDQFQQSIQACQTAALQMSSIGATEAFQQASNTYAATFIALHLLAAGVTLSIMATLNPLSTESNEAKLGIRKLLGMHAALKSRSMAAEQGMEVLKKLISQVLAKEMHYMMNYNLATEPLLSPGS